MAGYQFQGPAWERQPLLAFRGPEGTSCRGSSCPDDLADELRHYIASIAMAPDTARALITAPRGHRVLLLDRTKKADGKPPPPGCRRRPARRSRWLLGYHRAKELFSVPGDGSPPQRIDALDLELGQPPELMHCA
ncbi:DUF1513 domain-containing protein [Halomonas sp.]|uniref:DUF1513 domain-containing protein n=1 Tax=Halomonas sp. TaxID=1486246 RepID=UPI003A0FF099